MCLRVEERIRVPDVHVCHLGEVLHGEVVEVFFGSQYFHPAIVCFEKGREAVIALKPLVCGCTWVAYDATRDSYVGYFGRGIWFFWARRQRRDGVKVPSI